MIFNWKLNIYNLLSLVEGCGQVINWFMKAVENIRVNFLCQESWQSYMALHYSMFRWCIQSADVVVVHSVIHFKTPQTYRNVIYGSKCNLKQSFAHDSKLVFNKIFSLVLFSCIDYPFTAKDTNEKLFAK